ncbi:CCA tRNA nucleotidyltransferase [Alkalihalobacillus oceani]|uniref:CCA tRNA nucleotidyltransferase n=1 Tax=Halalkalibacter oceani TaxID=1653776 RepID=A0A9X2DP72_9BACI|nr:CCA tRNA nucleotidyltransferase [Halalkalibacter oceani]MCM3713565.1 CCA tRNA nucleotidyltransferase [Halalkalibacter oceani]
MQSAWKEALHLIQIVERHGYQAYIVGGAVRDWLLAKNSADIDIVTSARPEELGRVFSKTFQMNTAHQTVIVRSNGHLFEVTTLRGATIEDDLCCRDLTINSIALTADETVLDPAGGREDLKLGRLRSIDPESRMTEDPLRMLRVYRFASQLGFAIDEELQKVIHCNKERIRETAVERITKEWLKLLKGPARTAALAELRQSGLHHALAGLAVTDDQLEALAKLPGFEEEASEELVWTAFFLCRGETEVNLGSLALSKASARAIRKRLSYFQLRREAAWSAYELYRASLEVARDVERLRSWFGYSHETDETLQAIWDGLVLKQKSDLAISGHDLLQKGRKPGPWLKKELEWAERAVLSGRLPNDHRQIIAALEERRETE